MMKLRSASALSAVFLLGVMALGACSAGEDEENASIVNVEKGVAPAIYNSELSALQPEEQPVGIIGGETVVERESEPVAVQEEAATSAPETQNNDTEE